MVVWSKAKACVTLKDEKRIDCALRGFNGGWKALTATHWKYVDVVREYERQLRALAPKVIAHGHGFNSERKTRSG